ncbi:MAG: hypothetical protein Q7S57_05650 [bacterium]|nr:hypothetical protein [bacterium]
MNDQQDKNLISEPIKPPVVNNPIPQTKVVSDIIPEVDKSLLIKPNDQLLNIDLQSKEKIAEVKQKNDFKVLTAVPLVVDNNASSILLGIEEKKPFNRLFIITPFFLLVLAGFAVAFYSGVLPLPFWGLTHEQVIEKMFDAIPNIRSGRFGMEINFKSSARQAGMQGYDLSPMLGGAGNGASVDGAGERDRVRLNATSDIATALEAYKKQNGKYPQFLNDIKIVTPDIILDPASKNQFGYRQEKGGMDFTLHIQMETDQGINNFRNAVLVIPSASLQTVEDKLAVVHADTPKLKKQNVSSVSANTTPAYDPTVVLQNLPSEIDANLRFSGLAKQGIAGSDALLNIDGSLKLSGMSFSAGLGLIKKGDIVYGKVKEVPTLGFFDLAVLRDKWVKLEKADLSKLGFKDADQQLQQENMAKYLVLAKTYLQILKEEKVFSVVKELPKTKDKNDTYYHYAVNINSDKIAVIYERLNAEIKKQFGGKGDYISADLIAYLRGSEYAKINKISQQNTQIEIWIDTKNFWPHKFTSNSVFVPPDNIQKLKDKQYLAQVTFDLFDVNKPIVVDAPTEFISLDDAQKLVTGK